MYQVKPLSRITGEGRAEFLRTWGPGFNPEGAGGAAQPVRGNYKSFKGISLTVMERMHQFIMGGGGTGGAAQSVRGNYKPFKGINPTVLERMHQFVMYFLCTISLVRYVRVVVKTLTR